MSAALTEHFDYLALEGREALYAEAIARVLRPGDIVADLGCGFGILGIQCLRAGAAHVYGVDGSDAIEIAREAVARAGLADRYTCLRGASYRTVLPEQVDLVICDHVGWFGFDYDIIPMLEDARRRLLKPGGRIMPQALRLVLAGVSSDPCRALLDQWSTPPIPADFAWLSEYQRNLKHPRQFQPQEICTAPVAVGEIDLTIDSPDAFTFKAALVAEHDARFDGIGGWFECALADDVWMTNSPLAAQRIARQQIYLGAHAPFAVRAGERIEVSVRARKDGQPLAWTVRPPGGAKQQLSTFNALVLGADDLAAPSAGPLALGAAGAARRTLVNLVDGQRSAAQIEEEALALHRDLYPTEHEIRLFIRAELARITRQC